LMQNKAAFFYACEKDESDPILRFYS